VAGVAAAAIGSPAAAADGLPVIQGQVNTGGDSTTGIVNNSLEKPTVRLENEAGGAPLQLTPGGPTFDAPVGSVFADEYGALYTVGDQIDTPGGTVTEKFIGRLSPAFSTSVLPITPERWLVTIPNFLMPNGFYGRDFVVPGSANYDSAGRVLPKNNDNVPDLILDFSEWYYEFGIVGVQGTLLVMNATANGFVSLYDSPVWPGTSSMNFQAGEVRDGFTQMGLTLDGRVNFKVSAPVILVFDIFAFIVGNGTIRLSENLGPMSANRAVTGTAGIPIDQRPRKRSRS
jgi:hypothetical protein